MKKNIHPKYEEITAFCSCGNIIKISSSICHNLNLDVCDKCHPFFTGKQRIIDVSRRIERFNKRFNFSNKEKEKQN